MNLFSPSSTPEPQNRGSNLPSPPPIIELVRELLEHPPIDAEVPDFSALHKVTRSLREIYVGRKEFCPAFKPSFDCTCHPFMNVLPENMLDIVGDIRDPALFELTLQAIDAARHAGRPWDLVFIDNVEVPISQLAEFSEALRSKETGLFVYRRELVDELRLEKYGLIGICTRTMNNPLRITQKYKEALGDGGLARLILKPTELSAELAHREHLAGRRSTYLHQPGDSTSQLVTAGV